MEFELELVDFDKAPNWEAMGADAKIARAEALKEQGNRVFKGGPALFKHAAQKWTKAIQLVDHAFDIDTAEQVRPALLLVLAMASTSPPGAASLLDVVAADGGPPRSLL